MNVLPELKSNPRLVVTDKVIELVTLYLACKACFQVLRAKVDAVQIEVLTRIPLYDDYFGTRRGLDPSERKLITDPKDVYLSKDEESLARYYEEVKVLLGERGIRPPDLDRDYCPALVAEGHLIDVERLICDEAGQPFGLDADKLLGSRNGVENKKKFVGLIVAMTASIVEIKMPSIQQFQDKTYMQRWLMGREHAAVKPRVAEVKG